MHGSLWFQATPASSRKPPADSLPPAKPEEPAGWDHVAQQDSMPSETTVHHPARLGHWPAGQEAPAPGLSQQLCNPRQPPPCSLSLSLPICKISGGAVDTRQGHVMTGSTRRLEAGPRSAGKCLTPHGAASAQNALRSRACVRYCWDIQGQDCLREVIPYASIFEPFCLCQGEPPFEPFTTSPKHRAQA